MIAACAAEALKVTAQTVAAVTTTAARRKKLDKMDFPSRVTSGRPAGPHRRGVCRLSGSYAMILPYEDNQETHSNWFAFTATRIL